MKSESSISLRGFVEGYRPTVVCGRPAPPGKH